MYEIYEGYVVYIGVNIVFEGCIIWGLYCLYESYIVYGVYISCGYCIVCMGFNCGVILVVCGFSLF